MPGFASVSEARGETTVIVETAVPFAMTPVSGDAVAVVSTALRLLGSPTNVTAGCCASTTSPAPGLTVTVMFFVSAVVVAIVPVATPFASVTKGWTRMLLLPLESSCTTWPAIGLPFPSRTVTVIVETCAPSASTPVAGAAAAVVRTALTVLGSTGRIRAWRWDGRAWNLV